MAASPVREGTPGAEDDAWLRRAIALAQASRDAGRHPFGSLVVLDGQVIAESQSLKSRDRDATGHSEMTALRAASACRTRIAVRTAGSYALTCRINAATRAMLRHHALRLAITTRFTAANGKWSQFTRVITIPRLPKAPPRPEPVTG